MNINDIVYIKSCKAVIKNKPYKIVYINKTHAIITDIDNIRMQKISIDFLTIDTNKTYSSESIKKGDLVKCIDSFTVKEGIVLEVYNTFLLVLVGNKKRKITKNKVILLNT
tara:strand:- start:37 stop:369 length:333 start_codon:yes stop_codon:yes gene_type:complete